MNKSTTINMTAGSPLRLLIRFSIPMLIGNLFQQVYNLADSVIVGRLIGSGALAAVGATTSVSFLFFSVCNGIGSGGGIITSQYFGAGQEESVRKSIVNSAYLMLISAVVMGVLAFLAAPSVLRLMRTPGDIFRDAVTYMRVACISVPLVAIYNYASSMLRALGDSRTPLYFLICACILNIILDLLFIGPLRLGVFGAALATALSQMLAGLGCLCFAVRTNPYFRLRREHFAFNSRISFQAVRIGLPLALQWSMISISTIGLQTFVNSFGSTAVAAFTATSRVETLVHMPFASMGQALSTYAGQNYGAGRNERIHKGFLQSSAAVSVFAFLLFILMQFFGVHAVSVFVKHAEVIRLGGAGLRLTSWFYLFLAMIYVTRGIQNGVGDAMFSFINGIIEVICRIGLPYFMLFLFPAAGVYLTWWAAGLTWMISSVFCLMRYLRWRRK